MQLQMTIQVTLYKTYDQFNLIYILGYYDFAMKYEVAYFIGKSLVPHKVAQKKHTPPPTTTRHMGELCLFLCYFMWH